MRLRPVFDAVLRKGCGVTVEGFLSSEVFLKGLEKQKQLLKRHPQGSASGDILRTEIFKVGAGLLAKKKIGRPTTEAVAYRWAEERALLLALGDTLLEAAAKCLPESSQRSADSWPSLSADLQLQALRQLFEDIRQAHAATKDGKESWQRDVFVQPIDSVLPRLYGTVGAGGRPNCVGKAQIVAGFAKRIGARAFTLSPICSEYQLMRRNSAELAGTALLALQVGGERCSPNVMNYLESVVEEAESSWSYPDCFHAAVVIQLSDGRWVWVDPNFGLFGEVAHTQPLAAAIGKWRRAVSLLPGLSRQFATADRSAHYDQLRQVLKLSREILAASRYRPKLKSLAEEVGSSVLAVRELLLGETQFDKVREQLVSLALNPEEKSLPQDEQMGLAIERLLPGLSDEQIAQRTEMLRAAILRRGKNVRRIREEFSMIIEIASQLKALKLQAELMIRVHALEAERPEGEKRFSPVVELGDPAFTLASATFSHVAIELGLGEQAEQFLQQHCFNQFRLLYAAAFPEREQKDLKVTARLRQRALLAKYALQALPFRNATTEAFLAGINQVEVVSITEDDISTEEVCTIIQSDAKGREKAAGTVTLRFSDEDLFVTESEECDVDTGERSEAQRASRVGEVAERDPA